MAPSGMITLGCGGGRQLTEQEPPAGVDLAAERSVLRGHAAHGVGDPAVDQLEAVVGGRAVVTARKAEPAQGRIEDLAGMIAGERAAGPIGAAQSGGEADDQQSRRGVAERRDRGVVPVRKSAPVGGAKGGQTRAELTVRMRRAGPRVHGAAGSRRI